MTSPYYPRRPYYRPSNEWQAVGSGLREVGRMLADKRRFEQTRQSQQEARDLSLAMQLAAGGGVQQLPEGADPSQYIELPHKGGYMPRRQAEPDPWDLSAAEQQRILDWEWRRANPPTEPEPVLKPWEEKGMTEDEYYRWWDRTHPTRDPAPKTPTPMSLDKAMDIVYGQVAVPDPNDPSGQAYMLPEGWDANTLIRQANRLMAGDTLTGLAPAAADTGAAGAGAVTEPTEMGGGFGGWAGRLVSKIMPGGIPLLPEAPDLQETAGVRTPPPEPTRLPSDSVARVTPEARAAAQRALPAESTLAPMRQAMSREATAARARELALEYAHLPKEQRDAKIVEIMTAEGFRVIR